MNKKILSKSIFIIAIVILIFVGYKFLGQYIIRTSKEINSDQVIDNIDDKLFVIGVPQEVMMKCL